MPDLEMEKIILGGGRGFVGGIDEAGRGPLAGPVVAACVLVDEEFAARSWEMKKINFINDSKKLTGKKREELYEFIKQEFCGVGLGVCDCGTIDRINILQAAFLAMKKAIGALKQKPDFVLVDGGFLIPNLSLAQKAVIKGDQLSLSIAAASIIAKVERDRMMEKMHKLYPVYGFDKHKGYGTKFHLEALKKYGPSPIHRKSFAPVKSLIV